MHCSSCGTSVGIQGKQQTASIGKSGGSISETKFNGVPVSIKKDIKGFFNKQYQAIKFPEAGTTVVRFQLNSHTIALLNEQQVPQCQLSIIYQSGIKTSANSHDTVVPNQAGEECFPCLSSSIQEEIKAFINGLYKSIGDKSGTTKVRHQLACWVNEVLNEDQASPCCMKLAVGPDDQASGKETRYIYDQYFSPCITEGSANSDLPIQLSQEGRNDPCQEEIMSARDRASQSSSGHTDAVSEASDAEQFEGEEGSGSKFAAGSDLLHHEDEERQFVEDKCVSTSDSKLEKGIPGNLKRSQSLEDGYGSLEPNAKVPEIPGLQLAQEEPENT